MRNSVFCHLENVDICPYDLFGCGLWIVVFAAFNCERLYECAVWVFLCQLWILAMKFLHQLVKFSLGCTASESEFYSNGKGDASGDTESDASSEGKNQSDEAEESSQGSADVSSESDRDVDALSFEQMADHVLEAKADKMQECKARLFYQMFAHGVVEFVHDGHVFQLTRDVLVTKQ